MVVVLDAVVQFFHVKHLKEREILQETGYHARHEGPLGSWRRVGV